MNERNETLRGVTSSILYIINELTLQHPRDKIIKDAIQAGKQVKESLLDPIATSFSDVSHYTGTVEEHEQVGYGHGTFILLAVDAILANLTRGSSLKKRKGPDTSSNNKNSKTDTADTDRKNGVMGPHNPNGGISNYGKGATVYNGRLKTGGSVLGRVMEDFRDTANKMKQANINNEPYLVMVGEATNRINSLDIVKNENFRFSSGGGGGPDRNKGRSGDNDAVERIRRKNNSERTPEYEAAMVKAFKELPPYTRKPNKPRNFIAKEIDDITGETIYTFKSKKNNKTYRITFNKEGFPVFDSKYETTLPPSYYLEPDSVQFDYLSKKLYEDIMKDPQLAKKFTQTDIELLKLGKKPKSLTWHHHQETGKMQLVDYYEHQAAGHTGGRAIWGGGEDGRTGKLKKVILEMLKR